MATIVMVILTLFCSSSVKKYYHRFCGLVLLSRCPYHQTQVRGRGDARVIVGREWMGQYLPLWIMCTSDFVVTLKQNAYKRLALMLGRLCPNSRNTISTLIKDYMSELLHNHVTINK